MTHGLMNFMIVKGVRPENAAVWKMNLDDNPTSIVYIGGSFICMLDLEGKASGSRTI